MVEFALSVSLKLSRTYHAVPSAILANTTVNVVRSINLSTEERFIAPVIMRSFPVPRYQTIRHTVGGRRWMLCICIKGVAVMEIVAQTGLSWTAVNMALGL